ncbi:WD repeat-containing protein 11-like isoform X3 [Branchiostoma floridae x Branchiostoma japonicum]
MKTLQMALTGALHHQNKGASDWGWPGLLAYGCQNFVVVVDTRTVQVIQTLDRHKTNVVKVKWARENYHHDLNLPYTLRLASADSHGRIVVWDVSQGLIRADFYDGTKPVQDLEWLSTQDACPTLLAAIHPPSSVVLWNADTGTKLWKKNFNETLLSFAFDPFNPANMTLLANDCILFVSDFMTSRPPSGTGRRFYISNPSSPVHSGAAEGGRSSERRTGGRSALRRNFKLLVGDVKDSVFPTSKGGEDTVTLNECLQLMYLRSCRNHLLLVYSKELLILDLEIKQTVGIVAIERSGSPFLQVIACRQRDALLCLHENGSVTVRVRRKVVMGPFSTPVDQIGNMASQQTGDLSPLGEQDVTYELRCQSEALRITKHIRISGMAACPVNERSVAVFVNDGRIMFWNLTTIPAVVQARDTPNHTQTHLSPLHSPGFSLSDSGSDPYKYPSSSSSSEASTAAASPAKTAKICSVPRMCNVPHTKMAICDMIGQTYGPTEPSVDRQGYVFRFTLQGLLSGLPLPPTIIKMCPPLTTKNWNVYRPLLAVGSSHGLVQVYNLSSGLLWREFNIHTCQVRGLEWTSLTSFLSFAYPSPGQSGLVKNELLLVNLQTGSSELFRGDKGNDESPIEIVRISHLKQYAIIVFKDKPMELWDIRSQTLLREMPKNFPTISALEWSPSNNLKSLKKKLSQDPTSAAASPTVELLPTIGTETKTQTDSKKLANLTVREHFVFTDSDGQLYHFMVEGNIVKDGSKIPPDGTMGAITCIAWKGDTMVLGDVDGNINIWDLKAKISRAVPTHRGWIKKLKFAPGRGNQKILVLYNDGAEVWDAKEVSWNKQICVEMVSSVKCPRDMAKVIDIDWASSDKPVLACDDGTVRVSDMDMKNACAPVTERDITEPVFSPHLVPPAAAFTVKYLLQHQPWNTDFSYSLTDLHGKNGEELQRIVNEQLQLIPSDLQEYLPVCPYGTAQRCLIVSRLFGDESELHFWTVALHNLRREQARLAAGIDKDLLPSTPTSDMFLPVDSASSSQGDLLASENTVGSSGDTTSSGYFPLDALSLDTCYDILCDQPFFQKYQLERINLHDSKRATYEHTQHCAEKLLMLGQSDRAVQLYLETDADNDNYFSDSLRACLIATIRSSGASQSTIKLVATNLIANGKLPEGVQLLCLIDKAFDACRYLQDYGEWDQAAWLAKASLNNVECSEVMKRWVDHLCSSAVNYKSKAILVLLSLGHFLKVLELLYSMRHFDRAALFAEACLEFGVLILNEETSSLIEAIFLEYARYLHNLGNLTAMEHYCHKAGGKGQQLLRDVQMENAQLQEKTAGEGSGDGGADQEGDADTSEGAEEGLL